MADEWDEDEVDTAKPIANQSKYSSISKKVVDDDAGWGGGFDTATSATKVDDDAGWGGGFGDTTSSNNNNGFGGGRKFNDQNNDRQGSGRPKTEWICTNSSCNGKNFGFRTDCFKCHESKGDAVDIPADSSGNNRGGGARTEWFCTDSSCNGKNFGFRTDCFKCHEPKGDAVDVPADSSGNSRGGGARTEWFCTDSSCKGKNFGFRTDCFKCHEPKGDAVDVPADSSSGGFKKEDWSCSCGASNFGNRTECFKCKAPKEENSNNFGSDNKGSGGGGGGGGRGKRDGDWTCTENGCNNSNFAFRTECQKCNAPKGENAGGDKNGDGTSGFQSEKPKEFYIPPELDENDLFSHGISSGINFDKFNDIPVKVTGDNKPKPIESFQESGLDPFLINNINKCNYKNPTPIQKNAIPIVLAGRDIMACAQTGSGKTAAFILPILHRLLKDNRDTNPGSPHVVIITPTRELASQIYAEVIKFSKDSFLKAHLVYGGTATRHQSTNVAQSFHILVATPGRLLDFVEKGYISFDSIRFVVLDEADRMLDMGFMPAVKNVMNNPTMVSIDKRQTLMFSATFPEEIQKLAGQFLNNYLFITIGIVGGACTDVEQNFYNVSRYEKRTKLMEILNAEDPKGTMVFVETKRNADFLASFLSESKHATTSIHGDRMQRQREEALKDFKTGKMKVLIATSVAARGLDIPNVRHVINYDLPKSIDDYVHRIGRTGRVGNKGKATSFYESEQDAELTNDLVKILQQAQQIVPEFLLTGGNGGFGADSSQNRSFGGSDIRSKQASSVPEAHGGGGDDEDW